MVSSNGIGLRQAMTDASTLALAAVDGASGYAEQTSWRVSEIDPAATAERAVATAERTRGAHELEPGSYAAVLEPYAIAELLLYFAYDAFSARGLLEERSFAPAGWARRSSTSASRSPRTRSTRAASEGVRLRGDAEAPRGAGRGGRPEQRFWDRRTAYEAGTARSRTAARPLPLLATGALSPSRCRWPAATQNRPKSSRSASATASTSPGSTTSASSTRARA